MSYNLIVVESPAKCKKIEHILKSGFPDENFIVIATKGHIKEIEKLKIDLKNYDPEPVYTFKKNKTTEKITKTIKDLYKNAKELYIATDLDYSGSFIGWSVCDLVGADINKTKRLIFNSITKDVIINAYKNPTKLNINHVNYEKTRQIIDQLIGFKLTKSAYQYLKSKNNSIGRCQTVALKLIVEKNNEIDDYLSCLNNSFYNISSDFKLNNFTVKARGQVEDNKEVKTFNNPKLSFYLSDLKTVEKSKKPPKPFITSTIQIAAASTFGYSIKSTMKYLQNLYEKGFITYMRTDCPIISKEFKEIVDKHIIKVYGNCYLNPFVSEEILQHSQNGHEAIRITDLNRDIEKEKITDQEKNIYRLICKNTIQSQMSNYRYKESDLQITNNLNETVLSAKLKTLIFDGFKKLDEKKNKIYLSSLDIEKIKNRYLNNHDPLNFNSIDFIQTYKNPPKQFNEQKLVKKLESLGIGRPSTYVSFVDKIKTREYVNIGNIPGVIKDLTNYKIVRSNKSQEFETIKETKKIFGDNNKFIPSFKGKKIIEFMNLYYDYIVDYGYTSKLETELDKIASGEVDYKTVVKNFWDTLKAKIIAFNSANSIKKKQEKQLGIYKNLPVFLKNGSNGPYIYYNESTYSLPEDIINKGYGNIKISDIIKFLDNTVGYYLDKEIKTLIGKYGPYFVYDKKNYKLSNEEYASKNIYDICVSRIKNNSQDKVIELKGKKYYVKKSIKGNYYISVYDVLENNREKFKTNHFIKLKSEQEYVKNDINNINESFITKFNI